MIVDCRSIVEQVFILTQAWSDSYYHFVAESLPRISLFLDVLLRYTDIKVRFGMYNYDLVVIYLK